MPMHTKILGRDGVNPASTANPFSVSLDTTQGYPSVATTYELDSGFITGTPQYRTPEVDTGFRMRTAKDTVLFAERFGSQGYTAQNTGKFYSSASTMGITHTTNGVTITCNSVSTAIGALIGSYQVFRAPSIGGSLYATNRLKFASDTIPQSFHTYIGFLPPTTPTTAPTNPVNGAYFRFTGAGVTGNVSANGSEFSTNLSLPAGLNLSDYNEYIVDVTKDTVDFWIGEHFAGRITGTTDAGLVLATDSLHWGFMVRSENGSVPSVYYASLESISIIHSGADLGLGYEVLGQMLKGSYRGLSGTNMGGLSNYTNSQTPTAFVPSNTSLPPNSGLLGGQFYETATLTVASDGILSSFQNLPSTGIGVPSTLVVFGVTLSSIVQTTFTGGGFFAQYSLAAGGTAVSLATTESTSSKSFARIPLGIQSYPANDTALTLKNEITRKFTAPIIINPGEYLHFVTKHIGTNPTAGVIAHTITYDYTWI